MFFFVYRPRSVGRISAATAPAGSGRLRCRPAGCERSCAVSRWICSKFPPRATTGTFFLSFGNIDDHRRRRSKSNRPHSNAVSVKIPKIVSRTFRSVCFFFSKLLSLFYLKEKVRKCSNSFIFPRTTLSPNSSQQIQVFTSAPEWLSIEFFLSFYIKMASPWVNILFEKSANDPGGAPPPQPTAAVYQFLSKPPPPKKKKNFRHLQVWGTLVEEFQHVHHRSAVLDDEVELHVELAADQLRRTKRKNVENKKWKTREDEETKVKRVVKSNGEQFRAITRWRTRSVRPIDYARPGPISLTCQPWMNLCWIAVRACPHSTANENQRLRNSSRSLHSGTPFAQKKNPQHSSFKASVPKKITDMPKRKWNIIFGRIR